MKAFTLLTLLIFLCFYSCKKTNEQFSKKTNCTSLLSLEEYYHEIELAYQKNQLKPIRDGAKQIKEYVKCYPLTQDNLVYYNNLGYYFEQSENEIPAVFILKKVIQKFPDRVVAYINIADAYWDLGKIRKAKRNYKEYTEQMRIQKKDLSKIPPIVYVRISE